MRKGHMRKVVQEDFAIRLNSALEATNTHYSQLAQDLGLDNSTVYKWTKGGSIPRVRNIRKVEQYLGLSPGSLTLPVGSLSETEVQYVARSELSESLVDLIVKERNRVPDSVKQSILNLLVSIRSSRW